MRGESTTSTEIVALSSLAILLFLTVSVDTASPNVRSKQRQVAAEGGGRAAAARISGPVRPESGKPGSVGQAAGSILLPALLFPEPGLTEASALVTARNEPSTTEPAAPTEPAQAEAAVDNNDRPGYGPDAPPPSVTALPPSVTVPPPSVPSATEPYLEQLTSSTGLASPQLGLAQLGLSEIGPPKLKHGSQGQGNHNINATEVILRPANDELDDRVPTGSLEHISPVYNVRR